MNQVLCLAELIPYIVICCGHTVTNGSPADHLFGGQKDPGTRCRCRCVSIQFQRRDAIIALCSLYNEVSWDPRARKTSSSERFWHRARARQSACRSRFPILQEPAEHHPMVLITKGHTVLGVCITVLLSSGVTLGSRPMAGDTVRLHTSANFI